MNSPYRLPNPMIETQLGSGYRLSCLAGWNQTEADWKAFFDLGTLVNAQNSTGEIVATAGVLPLDARVSWISLVLVDPEHRRQGIASALLDWAIGHCRDQGRSALLDATPEGARVYSQLGFAGTETIVRCTVEKQGRGNISVSDMQRLGTETLAVLGKLDAEASGINRSSLYRYWYQSGMASGWFMGESSHPEAWAFFRAGRNAPQIGPLFANSQSAAESLIHGIFRTQPGPCIMDLTVSGLRFFTESPHYRITQHRSFLRMQKDKLPSAISPHQFAIGGPEFS
jgi:GNAT superfamily N-acetyltransferase